VDYQDGENETRASPSTAHSNAVQSSTQKEKKKKKKKRLKSVFCSIVLWSATKKRIFLAFTCTMCWPESLRKRVLPFSLLLDFRRKEDGCVCLIFSYVFDFVCAGHGPVQILSRNLPCSLLASALQILHDDWYDDETCRFGVLDHLAQMTTRSFLTGTFSR
jgi:hypothetical protein